MKPRPRHWVALPVLLALTFGVATLGALATGQSVGSWYASLAKPPWTPPDAVFGPVWTLLYAAMAFAAWRVWRRRQAAGATLAMWLFGGQLLLNAAWSPAFFGLRSPLAGLLVIVPLWAAVGATAVAFWRVVAAAGWLFVPYWVWVSFATVLNLGIWRLNA